jgi:hypothetical protein
VVDRVQCILAIAVVPVALGVAWRLMFGIGKLFGTAMNSNGSGRTRLNLGSARDGSSAASRRTPILRHTQTRDRERRGENMKAILSPVPGGFNFTA